MRNDQEYIAQFAGLDWERINREVAATGKARLGGQSELWPGRTTIADDASGGVDLDRDYGRWVACGERYAELVWRLAWFTVRDQDTGAVSFWVRPLP